MEEEIIDQFEFQDCNKQNLFETLLSRINNVSAPFTKEDLKVDLVLRMKMPSQSYQLKAQQPSFDQLFNNTPPIYEEVYHLVEEYIDYLVENNQENYDAHNPSVRALTSIREINPPKVKKRKLQLDNDQSLGEEVGSSMEIECNYAFEDKIDTFTLRYNMTMLILKKLCGFRVKTFIMQDSSHQKGKGDSYIYFLLSLSNDCLMKLSDKYRIKKQIDMATYDFSINDPTDGRDRPLKINSFFKRLECKGFNEAIRRLNRDLNLSNKDFLDEIKQNVELNQQQIQRFQAYFQELQTEVHKVLPPTDMHMHNMANKISGQPNPAKFQTSLQHIASDVSLNKIQALDEVIRYQKLNKNLKKLSKQQKQYIYEINRHKINPGCEQYMLNLKKRKYLFHKIIELNKKYKYRFFQYSDCFVEFVLPSKHKPFFQKLHHLLQYQWYHITPYGELSLFTSGERIKIAFLNLQEKLKVENWKKFGTQIFPLNSLYEISGDTSHLFNKNYAEEDQKPVLMDQNSKMKFLKDAWNSWIPLKTNIRVVRDYMGDNFTLHLSFKIFIIGYLLLMVPFSLGLQFSIQFYFINHRQKQYILNIGQLALLCFTYTIFISLWKKYQTKFFHNFVEEHERNDTRAAYKGPYVRSIINDKTNIYKTSNDWRQKFRISTAEIGVLALLVIEGVFFYGMRRLIVAQYSNFPDLYFLSSVHLVYYGIFFSVNRIFYYLFIKKFLNKLSCFLNLAKMSQHQQAKRKYNDYLVFGLELIGPFFFYIFQNLNGSTCYSVSCRVEFEYYIIARYIILGCWHLIKAIAIGIDLGRNKLIERLQKETCTEPREIQQTFQYKFSQLLSHIEFEQQKQEIDYSMKEEKTIFMFFPIFFLRFPFCGIFSLLTLLITYIIHRYQTVTIKRRPIPDTAKILKLTPVVNRMYIVALILNSWSIVFNNNFMEYDLTQLYTTFVSTFTQTNMLTFKLITVVVIFISFYVLSLIFRIIAEVFEESEDLQKRKMNKFKTFLKKIRGEASNSIVLQKIIPLRSIFRTYAIETVIQYKKNKFNFLKRKLRPVPPPQQKQKSIYKSNAKSVSHGGNLNTMNRTFNNYDILQRMFKRQSKLDQTYS